VLLDPRQQRGHRPAIRGRRVQQAVACVWEQDDGEVLALRLAEPLERRRALLRRPAPLASAVNAIWPPERTTPSGTTQPAWLVPRKPIRAGSISGRFATAAAAPSASAASRLKWFWSPGQHTPSDSPTPRLS
jgi:hypothetical protein